MMHQYIYDLLENYTLTTLSDYENALKEIIQQVVLTPRTAAAHRNGN